MPLADDAEQFFRPGGPLSKVVQNYEWRPEQAEMARAVADALANRRHLLVEAGTGTGKSLAYLLPALLHKKRVVIATHTKNLQSQLFEKDLPILERAGLQFKAALLKGRDNYLCITRHREFDRAPLLEIAGEAPLYKQVSRWARRTETGDREELDALRDDTAFWRDLNARADTCLGQKCPDFNDCFLTKMRMRAGEADLLIVNHHLFFADLALRREGPSMVFPDYDAVVFDEAHELEETAAEYFGAAVTQFRIWELVGDARRALSGRPAEGEFADGLKRTRDFADAFFNRFDGVKFRAELHRLPEFPAARPDGLRLALTLRRMGDKLRDAAADDAILARLSERASQLGEGLEFILEEPGDGFVHWAEKKGRAVILGATPISVAEKLSAALYEHSPCILTSATLKGGADFSYARARLGLTTALELDLPSPFDHANQAALFIPKKLPPPDRGAAWEAAVVELIPRLISITHGRTFVLLTSLRMVDKVAEALTEGEHPWPLFIQGEAPRARLLERFRDSGDGVLIATQSFWQGVDVQGEALSQVIIDKIPFPVPGDPVVKARGDEIAAKGGDSFMDYFIPEAAILLQQGLGRLIRSKRDTGILSLLDSRAATRGYGKKLLAALPPYPRVETIDQLETFWRSVSGPPRP